MKILVAYDGSLHSMTGLRFGMRMVREKGGEVLVLHTFNSGMFIDYGAGPRAIETARQESMRHVENARKLLREEGSGIRTKVIVEEGDPRDEAIACARLEKADLIIAPPRYDSLVKDAPCPVSIIPGNILFPVDSTDSYTTAMEDVVDKALATTSRVLILGIVPIHLYNKWEEEEIKKIRKATSHIVKKASVALTRKGIATEELLRSGYPDEEIVKVADTYPIAMIVIPEGGDVPSELGKAASIILDEESTFRKAVELVPHAKEG